MTPSLSSPIGPRIVFDGRSIDYYGGSGYLCLQAHPEVIRAGQEALERYGLSTATSRGGFGEHPVYAALERAACAFFEAEKVLLLPSGYLGAAVLTQTSGREFEHIFIDADAHYSLWDAAQATNQPITPFAHRRPEALAEVLHRELHPSERPLVLSDGVFPISGEIAPLPAYLEAVKAYDGQVYLDDAHAVGVLGANGRGTAEYYGITSARCKTAATLAKALGGFGGILWGRAGWIEQAERNSRIFTGASPLPLVTAAAAARALELAQDSLRRKRLWDNVSRLRSGLRGLGWDLEDTPVPILCLRAQQEISLERIRAGLYEHGIGVELIRSYTSAPPGGCLRIAVFSEHSEEQIERLLAEIGKLIRGS